MSRAGDNRKLLRQELRQRRRALGRPAQKQASKALCRHFCHSPDWIRATGIALYWPNDGEIDPRPLAKRAWAQGKQVYLPVLSPHRQDELLFLRWKHGDRLKKNRFGIPEPVRTPSTPLWTLSLILMPLVGFDPLGNRLGMGGGFYDRTLARLRGRPHHPRLIGLAHACQEVDRLPAEPWDYSLHAIATDTRLLSCSH